MKDIYTITKWKFSGHGWMMSNEYSFNSIVCSFGTKKEANDYLKNEMKATYEKGYWFKGDNLYTVRKTKLF